MNTSVIENFPGFPEGKMGPELMFQMRAQAERFGAIMRDEYVLAVDFSKRPFKLWSGLPPNVTPDAFERGTAEEHTFWRAAVQQQQPTMTADAVVLSLGGHSKLLDIPGEKAFMGKGVSTCAVCDAAFYRDAVTIVSGGGDSACEDTLALTKFAKQVIMVVRGPALRASKVMQERVRTHPKVKIHFHTAITEIKGEGVVKSVVLKDTRPDHPDADDTVTNEMATEELAVDGVFIAIGHLPMTQIVRDHLQLDTHGFIVTRQSPTDAGVALARAALSPSGAVTYPTMTSVEGVFAAGDCVDPRYWQAITAAGQGCMAAIDAERWLEKR
jgi:thioredoxin reductase (NADPH)